MTDVSRYRVGETAEYICTHGWKRVAAQFSDDDLPVAADISEKLRSACRENGHRDVHVYILADTTYNSLGVDEVASSHIDADCIIHYGRASLTPVSGRVPVFYVFPRNDEYTISEEAFTEDVIEEFRRCGGRLTVFVDQVFSHCMGAVRDHIERHVNRITSNLGINSQIEFPTLVESHEANVSGRVCGGYCLSTEEESATSSRLLVWVGDECSPAKEQLMLTFNSYSWLSIAPKDDRIQIGLPKRLEQVLRRRYYLVEKARNASIVGILVGTLGAAGYKNSIDSLRIAAKEAGKKTYTLLMGKPNPAKLANFPEIDIFVLVADPQGQIMDPKDYLAPIITPYEAMVAFTDESEWNQSEYSLDIGVFASCQSQQDGDASHALARQALDALQISKPSTDKDITVTSSAEYLVHKRTWKGVEAPSAGAEHKPASKVQDGQHGRAAIYTHEA